MKQTVRTVMSAFGPKQTRAGAPHASAFRGKADIAATQIGY